MYGKNLQNYIRNLEILEGNQKLINREYDTAIENNKLQRGLPVNPIELPPSQYEDRETIVNSLKRITYEPNKFFSMIYDNFEIGALSQYLPQFLKTVGLNRSNLTANQLYKIWEDFKEHAFNAKLEVAGIAKPDMDYEEMSAKALQAQERTKIRGNEKKESENISKLAELEKKIRKMSYDTNKLSYLGSPDEYTAANEKLNKVLKEREKLVKQIKLDTASEASPSESIDKKFKESIQTTINAVLEKKSMLQMEIDNEQRKRNLRKLRKEYEDYPGHRREEKAQKIKKEIEKLEKEIKAYDIIIKQ